MTAAIRNRPEAVPVGLLLSAVGGCLDAYTYVGHGGVFANAQTGNVVLLAVGAVRGQFAESLRHLPPLVSFVLGLAVAESLARPWARTALRRPTRVVLAAEAVVLAVCATGTLPSTVVTVAVAFVAALQVSTFKKAGDVGYNATVTTGNLRSLVAEFAAWWSERRPGAGRRTAVLGGIVVSFATGAAVGTGLTLAWGDGAAAAAAGAIVVVLVAIVVETRRRERTSGAVEDDDGAGGR